MAGIPHRAPRMDDAATLKERGYVRPTAARRQGGFVF